MWLSNAFVLESKGASPSGLSSVTVLLGTIVGKKRLCTPPIVWPHATSWIISVGVKPIRAKAALCDSSVSCGSGTPVGPGLTASTRPPRKSIVGPPLLPNARQRRALNLPDCTYHASTAYMAASAIPSDTAAVSGLFNV
jgi:hypothetical protein